MKAVIVVFYMSWPNEQYVVENNCLCRITSFSVGTNGQTSLSFSYISSCVKYHIIPFSLSLSLYNMAGGCHNTKKKKREEKGKEAIAYDMKMKRGRKEKESWQHQQHHHEERRIMYSCVAA